MWAGDETHDEDALPSASSDQPQMDFNVFTPEAIAVASHSATGKRKRGSENTTSSTPNGNNRRNHTPIVPGVLRSGEMAFTKATRGSLPAEKAFPIQIGWKLFRLSGASLMSDSPSYFSAYFEDQIRNHEDGAEGSLKTLYIDRDPNTFGDICRHLQGESPPSLHTCTMSIPFAGPMLTSPPPSGYYILPRDGLHYIKLFADAQFYSLPRLTSQLFESDIFTTVGGQAFQIPRDTFSGAGNSSNFFTLGFAGFMSTPGDAFPGLESRGLMRPPPIPPQSVPNRSPAILTDLINLSRGYPVTIRDPQHRAALLGDCKYYGFKGLMHKLFACNISYNAARQSTEIVMRLEDLHKSGISFYNDPSPADSSPLGGWVYYARPFVDETSYEAIVEIGAQEETRIDLRAMRAEFFGDTKARIASLFQTVADKMNLPSSLPLGLMMNAGGASAAPASPANTPLSEDRVKIHLGGDAHITLDGAEFSWDASGRTTAVGSGSASGGFLSEQEESSPASSVNNTPILTQWPHNQSSSSSSHHLSPHIPQHQQQQAHPSSSSKKRKRHGSMDDFGEWIVRKGQWRLRVQSKTVEPLARGSRGLIQDQGGGMEILLWAVKLDAVSGQRGRNMGRDWVS